VWRWVPIVLLFAPVAEAGKRNRRGAEEETPPAPPPVPRVPALQGLFDGPLPIDHGSVPDGLANSSAQGCAACHPSVAAAWSASAHARPPSDAMRAAAADADNPACLACHQPLADQHSLAFPFAFGVDRTTPVPSPRVDLTLRGEGVSCAACHLRDGVVAGLTDTPVAAPHRTQPAPDLDGSEACVRCHQLEVGGAVLYDTVSSWSASPHAAAGLGCLDCHGDGGPDGVSVGHTAAIASNGSGVSLLVSASDDRLVRGGEPLTIDLVLQNTGTGHHWPSSSPWKGARLVASLVTHDDDGQRIDAASFAVDLQRTFGDAWELVDDSRLPPGGQGSWQWMAALDQDAPPGPYHLVVEIRPLVNGEVVGPPAVAQHSPLRVD
jgi:hypothetical protein